MSMINAGLACALIYWVINVTDSLIGWQTLSRPIVVAPITGLILGDFQTGIIMGASLEALYMGISAIGGVVPADALTSSIIAVAFSIVTHSDMETGLALAMPIGTIMSNLRIITFTVSNMLHEFFFGMTKRGEYRKYEIALFGYHIFISPLLNVLIFFFAIGVGAAQLEALLAALPAFILGGFQAAGGLLTAVGLALLSVSIWSNETGFYVLLGFILAKYLGLSTLVIAVIAGIICLSKYFTEIKIKNNTAVLSAANTMTEEEDDFYA